MEEKLCPNCSLVELFHLMIDWKMKNILTSSLNDEDLKNLSLELIDKFNFLLNWSHEYMKDDDNG